MKNRPIILTLLFASLLFLGGASISLGDIGKLCLFSGISGVITLNGEPVKNAKIKRVVRKAHSDKEKIDETSTDDKGHFSMPAVWDRSLIGKVLPMEFAVPQQLIVSYQGLEYEIWSGVKRKPEENSESSGNPLVVSCELTDEPKLVEVGGGFVKSKCNWNYEEDPPFEIPPPVPDNEI